MSFFRHESNGGTGSPAICVKNGIDYITRNGELNPENVQVEGMNNGTPEELFHQMIELKEDFNRMDNGKQVFHFHESWRPEESVNEEQAREFGRLWMQKMITNDQETLEGCQIICCTHTDSKKGHIHNHYLVNSVREDGTKLRIEGNYNKGELKNVYQKAHNEVCKEHGLEPIRDKNAPQMEPLRTNDRHREVLRNRNEFVWADEINNQASEALEKSYEICIEHKVTKWDQRNIFLSELKKTDVEIIGGLHENSNDLTFRLNNDSGKYPEHSKYKEYIINGRNFNAMFKTINNIEIKMEREIELRLDQKRVIDIKNNLEKSFEKTIENCVDNNVTDRNEIWQNFKNNLKENGTDITSGLKEKHKSIEFKMEDDSKGKKGKSISENFVNRSTIIDRALHEISQELEQKIQEQSLSDQRRKLFVTESRKTIENELNNVFRVVRGDLVESYYTSRDEVKNNLLIEIGMNEHLKNYSVNLEDYKLKITSNFEDKKVPIVTYDIENDIKNITLKHNDNIDNKVLEASRNVKFIKNELEKICHKEMITSRHEIINTAENIARNNGIEIYLNDNNSLALYEYAGDRSIEIGNQEINKISNDVINEIDIESDFKRVIEKSRKYCLKFGVDRQDKIREVIEKNIMDAGMDYKIISNGNTAIISVTRNLDNERELKTEKDINKITQQISREIKYIKEVEKFKFNLDKAIEKTLNYCLNVCESPQEIKNIYEKVAHQMPELKERIVDIKEKNIIFKPDLESTRVVKIKTDKVVNKIKSEMEKVKNKINNTPQKEINNFNRKNNIFLDQKTYKEFKIFQTKFENLKLKDFKEYKRFEKIESPKGLNAKFNQYNKLENWRKFDNFQSFNSFKIQEIKNKRLQNLHKITSNEKQVKPEKAIDMRNRLLSELNNFDRDQRIDEINEVLQSIVPEVSSFEELKERLEDQDFDVIVNENIIQIKESGSKDYIKDRELDEEFHFDNLIETLEENDRNKEIKKGFDIDRY